MDILFCTSEAYPLIKTGGLADVSGSLPRALSELGNDVRVVLPAYPETLKRAGSLTPIASLTLTGASEPVSLLKGRFPGCDATLYLVDSPEHFARAGNPYVRDDGSDWPDNAARFALFARAVVALCGGMADNGWKPDVVHCNDWQTGLVPALLSQTDHRPATLFTVHNLAYQGLFPAETFKKLALPDSLWSIDGLEFHNMLSFLKGGIANADHVTTVSPTYAEEIRTPEFGYGLEGLLQYRSAKLSGILNGMDYEEWDPATDSHVERVYDAHSVQHKISNKLALQRELGLPVESHSLLFGHIGRLVDQKGVDLILDIVDELFEHPVQLAVLGNGDEILENQLLEAADRHPEHLAVHIGYQEGLAHRIEAGADSFLMPSRYEPCGLNQMYSMRYGTLPVVHRTGGLADTVTQMNKASLGDHTATGFLFDEDSAEALLGSCMEALAVYQARRVDWWKMVITGMKQDFSWKNSASLYQALYRQLTGTAAQQTAPDEPGFPVAGPEDARQAGSLHH